MRMLEACILTGGVERESPSFLALFSSFIWTSASLSQGDISLVFLWRLSVGAIVVLVVHVVLHMDSWAQKRRKESLTKPKLCPAFKRSIVVSQRKTN